jgi:hypothetical protein
VCWGSNLGPHACSASFLTLSYNSSPGLVSDRAFWLGFLIESSGFSYPSLEVYSFQIQSPFSTVTVHSCLLLLYDLLFP